MTADGGKEPKKRLLNKITGSAGRLARKRPWQVLGIFFVISLLLIIPILSMESETDPNESFMPDDPRVEAQQEIETIFSGDLMFLVILKGNDNVLSRDALLELDRYEAELRADPIVGDALDKNSSSGGIVHIGQMLAGRLMAYNTSLDQISEADLNSNVTALVSNPMAGAMLSTDLDTSGPVPTASYMMLLVQLDGERFKMIGGGPHSEEGFAAVDTALYHASVDFSSAAIEPLPLAGFSEEFDKGAQQAMVLLPIAVAVILVIISIALRKVWDVIIVLLAVPFIYLWMFGLTSLLGIQSNTLSMFAPIMVLALGIDYAIISLHRYHEERDRGQSAGAALEAGMTWTGAVVFLSALTTMVAFASNLLSSIGGLRDFGFTVAIGIVSAYVVMGFIVPVVVYLVDRRKDRGPAGDQAPQIKEVKPWLSRIIAPLHRIPILTLFVVALLAGASAYGLATLETTFDIEDFMGDDSPLLESLHIMEDEFPSQGTDVFSVLTKGDVATPEYLMAEEDFKTRAADARFIVNISGEVTGSSVSKYVREATANMTFLNESGLDILPGELPDTALEVHAVYDHIYEYGTPLSSNNDVQGVLYRDEAGDYVRARVVVETNAFGSDFDVAGSDLEAALAASTLDDQDSLLTGSTMIFAILSDEITTSMTRSIFITLAICFAILILAFRSIRQAAISILPVAIAALAIFGTMALLGYSLNMMTILLASISIGVGVDYSINYSERFREEAQRSTDIDNAANRAIDTSGKALLGAGASSGLGFAVLLFADLFMFRIFGTLTALMIAYSFLATMILLPILLRWYGKRWLKKPEVVEEPVA